LGKSGDRTTFIISAQSVRDISKYSAGSSEKELLILPGTVFLIDGVLDEFVQLRESGVLLPQTISNLVKPATTEKVTQIEPRPESKPVPKPEPKPEPITELKPEIIPEPKVTQAYPPYPGTDNFYIDHQINVVHNVNPQSPSVVHNVNPQPQTTHVYTGFNEVKWGKSFRCKGCGAKWEKKKGIKDRKLKNSKGNCPDCKMSVIWI